MSADLHFSGKITQKALVIKDDKVLIVREARYDGKWELPGGRLHNEESLFQGFHREIQEELGVEVIDERLCYSEQFREKHSGSWCVLMAYTCRLKNSDQEFSLAKEEVAECKWITVSELNDQPIYTHSLHALQNYFSHS